VGVVAAVWVFATYAVEADCIYGGVPCMCALAVNSQWESDGSDFEIYSSLVHAAPAHLAEE
jgi:hypothetical protein